HDLRGLSPARRDAEARRLSAAEARRPFDLAAGPPLRCVLIRLAEREWTLLFTLHHIAGDGWSLGVLSREVSELYGALSEGRAPSLPGLPVQYADFAAWQRGWLAGAALEAHLAWWRERLAGAPPVLELPTDRPRPPVHGDRGDVLALVLPPGVVAALRALARREGATLFMTLLAGFQALLARWSGQDDVLVGTPVAARDRTELEGLIGFFVNTLVLRAEVAGGAGFRELLAGVRESTLGAYQHQAIPFERLGEELAPERSLAYTPLFQVMFILQDLERGELRMGPLRVDPLPADAEAARFDLTLAMAERDEGLAATLKYRPELWERATAERMLGHLGVLLGAVAADPEHALGGIELLSPGERRQLLVEWNATERPRPAGLTLHGLFEAQARRTPGAVALVFEGASLGYAELDARAERLAGHLRGRGVGPETRVGVCAERSVELVVALLAVLKAGGAYVPVDPGYPAERIAYMLEDSGVRLLLTQERLLGRLPARAAGVLVLDGGALPAGPVEPAPVPVPPDALAYVIYTSGSTGRPKGAMNAHRGIVNRLLWMQEEYGLDESDAVLQKTPFGFDVSVWEFFWPLLAGARLVLARPEAHGDPAYLSELIERERVTTLHFVPPMLAAFLEAGEPARCGSLRRVVCSGEALPYELTERFFAALPGAGLHNLYGPTEAAVDVTYWACEPRARRVVPIGRPVANTRLYVLDARGEPVPQGVAGELYLGGVQVGRGYLARPELTAERFVPDAFGGPGARLYRTGDRARWTAEGEVEYLGRLDFQVKVRGFRIELGEIEEALLSHAGVREATVVVREDAPGERRLAGYLVPGEEGLDPAELRRHLRERLPAHLVPSALVVLDALPRTPGGKLDRRALPAPDASAAADDAFVAPRSPAEEILAGIWSEVLKLDRVGAHDNFFEIGGHSLLATRVVSRIRQAFGAEVPLRALFEAPTLAGLAERVEAALHVGAGGQAPPIRRVPRGGPLPVSFSQQRLWFVQQMEPESAAYNMPHVLGVRGRLDVDALERSFDALRARHETLRTVFAAVDGEPVQIVGAPEHVELPVTDVRGFHGDPREAEVRRLVQETATQPFDLATGPLLRVRLLRLDEEEWVLLIVMHHIVSDGWSTGVLVRELSACYDAFSRGGEPRLPPLPVQYADFAAWQRDWLSGETLELQLDWWRGRLAGAPPLLAVPTDRPRGGAQGSEGAHRAFTVKPETGAALHALARRERATLFMALVAAWQALLGRYSGQDDVLVGTPVAGRSRVDVEGLIGFFVNTLVLRADLSGDPAFTALLRRVREATLGAYAHQDVPFEKLVMELHPERSMTHTPFYQAVFTLQNNEAAVLRLGGLELGAMSWDVESARFDLSLGMREQGASLVGWMSYRTELFDGSTIERMLGHFAALLDGIAADDSRPIADYALLDGGERRQVLEEWNATARPYDLARPVHERIAGQARRTPDAPAVVSGAGTLTFAELEARADDLARRLRALGVGLDGRVGLLLERSADTVVAVLGILRAGAAYVALDPSYPDDRLHFMLSDAGATAVVTSDELAGRLSGFRGALLAPSPPGPLSPASGRKGEHDIAEDAGALSHSRTFALSHSPSPDNLAYVIYTSGSTGTPKGVLVTHRGLSNYLAWFDETVLGAEGFALPLVSRLSFDAHVRQLFPPLLRGEPVWVLPEETVTDPAALLDAISTHERVSFGGVPSLWSAMLE
ncbi:MAG TPA: amino acid adenylation domain-containing protein, partial [Longimicrobiaceae bacterium]|nr:amino acid adenylation domain-containing protein [Longimicrobiaceae bacterium]